MTRCDQAIVHEGQVFGCQREATTVKGEWCHFGTLGIGTRYRYTCDEHVDTALPERSRGPITDKED